MKKDTTKKPKKLKLGQFFKQVNEERPQLCHIAQIKKPEPDRVKPKLFDLPGMNHLHVCSIQTKSPEKPGISTIAHPLFDENVKTYGINVDASKEEIEELLPFLDKEQAEFVKKAKETPELYIKIIKNGPYEVHGPIPIKDTAIKTNAEGQSISYHKTITLKDHEPVLLCRCGHSKNMPFCDQSHLKFHFDGELTASNEPYNKAAKIYKGCPGVYLMDEERLCAILRFCDPDGSCWNLIKAASTDNLAIDESLNCASGRLTVIKDNKRCEPDLEKSVECIYDTEREVDGPLWVTGGIQVKSDDTDYEIRNRVTLCRCGRSFNKPFCDGEHLTCPKTKPYYDEEN